MKSFERNELYDQQEFNGLKIVEIIFIVKKKTNKIKILFHFNRRFQKKDSTIKDNLASTYGILLEK